MAGVDPEGPPTPVEASRSAYHSIVTVLLSGIAITVPLVVTLYVLHITFQFVRGALEPLVEVLALIGLIDFLERNVLVGMMVDLGLYADLFHIFDELVAVVTVLLTVVAVGLVAHHPWGRRAVGVFDVAISSIPGIGTVYRSFRRMGDVVLESDAENFEQVHLVELFGDGTYVIGFEVGHSPSNIQGATDDDVVTMFVPFAPNPVTGGLLIYVSRDRLSDVDMSVEEGIRNVITSGVAGQGSDIGGVDVSFQDVQEVLHGWEPAGSRSDDATDDTGTGPGTAGDDEGRSEGDPRAGRFG